MVTGKTAANESPVSGPLFWKGARKYPQGAEMLLASYTKDLECKHCCPLEQACEITWSVALSVETKSSQITEFLSSSFAPFFSTLSSCWDPTCSSPVTPEGWHTETSLSGIRATSASLQTKLEFHFLDKLRYQTMVRHCSTGAKCRSCQKNERNKELRVCVYTCKPRDESKLELVEFMLK